MGYIIRLWCGKIRWVTLSDYGIEKVMCATLTDYGVGK